MKVFKIDLVSNYKKIKNGIGISISGIVIFIKNNLIHNEESAAIIYPISKIKCFYINNRFCFKNIRNDFWKFYCKKINSKHEKVNCINIKYNISVPYQLQHYVSNYNGTIIRDDYNDIITFKNGFAHCENGPAKIKWHSNGEFEFHFLFNGIHYFNSMFTIKSWKKKVKELKRQEKLKIFK